MLNVDKYSRSLHVPNSYSNRLRWIRAGRLWARVFGARVSSCFLPGYAECQPNTRAVYCKPRESNLVEVYENLVFMRVMMRVRWRLYMFSVHIIYLDERIHITYAHCLRCQCVRNSSYRFSDTIYLFSVNWLTGGLSYQARPVGNRFVPAAPCSLHIIWFQCVEVDIVLPNAKWIQIAWLVGVFSPIGHIISRHLSTTAMV